MEFEEPLTNDALKKKFPSQFELVNHLIKQAQGMIYSGRASLVDVDSENAAVNVVAELRYGKEPTEVEIPEVETEV